jgi:hypothetical protein
MARPENLFRAPQEAWRLKPALAGFMRGGQELRKLDPDSHARDASRLGAGEAVAFLDDSPTLRPENLDLNDDQLETARFVLSPSQRASVSRRGAGGT